MRGLCGAERGGREGGAWRVGEERGHGREGPACMLTGGRFEDLTLARGGPHFSNFGSPVFGLGEKRPGLAPLVGRSL